MTMDTKSVSIVTKYYNVCKYKGSYFASCKTTIYANIHSRCITVIISCMVLYMIVSIRGSSRVLMWNWRHLEICNDNDNKNVFLGVWMHILLINNGEGAAQFRGLQCF